MLSNILAPLADGGKSHWPPSGVEAALSLWYDAVARIRLHLNPWMEKQSKHIAVSGWWISDHLPTSYHISGFWLFFYLMEIVTFSSFIFHLILPNN